MVRMMFSENPSLHLRHFNRGFAWKVTCSKSLFFIKNVHLNGREALKG